MNEPVIQIRFKDNFLINENNILFGWRYLKHKYMCQEYLKNTFPISIHTNFTRWWNKMTFIKPKNRSDLKTTYESVGKWDGVKFNILEDFKGKKLESAYHNLNKNQYVLSFDDESLIVINFNYYDKVFEELGAQISYSAFTREWLEKYEN